MEFHHLLNMTLVSVWMSIRVQISTYDAFHNVLFRLPLRAIHVFWLPEKCYVCKTILCHAWIKLQKQYLKCDMEKSTSRGVDK